MKGAKSMKKYNIGFIGSGKMAGAIIKGLLKSDFVPSKNILATQAEKEGLEEKEASLGVDVILDNNFLVEKSDVIFIIISRPWWQSLHIIQNTSMCCHWWTIFKVQRITLHNFIHSIDIGFI